MLLYRWKEIQSAAFEIRPFNPLPVRIDDGLQWQQWDFCLWLIKQAAIKTVVASI
jgi:hypothetical protein